MKKYFSLRRLCLSGILTAAALIAFVIESLFPPIFIPGARMGVSNVFILFAAITLGGGYAFIILTIKTVLGSVFMGNISAVLYSLPAGAIALSLELLLVFYTKRFSLVAISAVGGTVNLLLQNFAFCLITANFEYMVYAPYLTLIGVGAGTIVGLAVFFIVKTIPQNILQKFSLSGSFENKK